LSLHRFSQLPDTALNDFVHGLSVHAARKFVIGIVQLDNWVNAITDAVGSAESSCFKGDLDRFGIPTGALAPGSRVLQLIEDTFAKVALEDKLEVIPIRLKVVLDGGKAAFFPLAEVEVAAAMGALRGCIRVLCRNAIYGIIEHLVQVVHRIVAEESTVRVGKTVRVGTFIILGLDLYTQDYKDANEESEGVEESGFHGGCSGA